MADEKIKRLMTRADIITDIDNNISPIYFPDRILDKNRVSTYGYLTETQAESIEDTLIIEQTRAADYCPELSNNEIHVNQTAKIRGVGVERATPGTCYAVIGILKNDIITKGVRYSDTERRFLIDRRSTILYGGVNFSLDDDILVRAIRNNNRYIYTANYTMEHMVSGIMDSYLQVYESTNSQGNEILGMVVRLSQCRHNISDQTVVDNVEFTYDGLYFPYSNRMSSFEVYYKASPTDSEYTKAKMENYLTTASPSSKHLFYNDDESGMLKIMNNPWLGLSANSIVRVEILETLGAAGNISLNGVDRATFSMYQDAAYNYSGVYVAINILTDTTGGKDGDSLADLKERLIDAKVRRSNITTEYDILNYINDVDANIQLVKKRNDTEDRIYYLYTLVRDADNNIAPGTTKPLVLRGPVDADDPGDFDIYRVEDRRKILKANARFVLDENGRAGSYTESQTMPKDTDCVRRVSKDVKEILIVDPIVPPDPSDPDIGVSIGDIIRIRHTSTNGLFTDRTYTVSKHQVGYVMSECPLYPEDNYRIGAVTNGVVALYDNPSSTAQQLTVIPEEATLKADISTVTSDGWIYVLYLDYEGWCRDSQLTLDTLETIGIGTKLVVEDSSSEDFYHVYICSSRGDRYMSTHTLESGYVLKRHISEPVDEVFGERSFFLNCPYMMIVDDQDIANYYFNSVNTSAVLSANTSNTYFPYQLITRAVQIFRDSHASEDDDRYTFTVVGTMNTEDDSILVNEDNEIIDPTRVMCYLFFTANGTISSYLPMEISGYNPDTREFSFTGSIRTNDFITESGVLEILDGLYQAGTDDEWHTCDYKDASFTVYFMFKEGEDYADYATSDQIMTLLPSSRLRYEEKTGARGTANKDTYLYSEPKVPTELTYLDVHTISSYTTPVITSRTLHATVNNQAAFVVPGDLVGSTIVAISISTRSLVPGTYYNIDDGIITLIGFTLAVGDTLNLTISTPVQHTVAPMSSEWFSLSDGGDPLTPQSNTVYTILTDGSYQGVSFVWNQNMNVYSEWDGETGYVDGDDDQHIVIHNGDVVDIDDTKSTEAFYAVTYNEYEGYVLKDDLDYEDVMTPGGYVLMNSYYNNTNNLYNLILEYAKFTRSPIYVTNTGSSTYKVRAFGPLMETDETLQDALTIITTGKLGDVVYENATIGLVQRFGLTEELASYVMSNRINLLEKDSIAAIREQWADYDPSQKVETQYLVEAVPFLEFLFSQDHTANLYDKFKSDADVYTSLLKLTTDFEVALKYTATYGPSKYIIASGIRQDSGAETNVNLGNLNPTLYFKVYGLHVDVSAIYQFIYNYLRDHYITNEVIFASNICTAVENNFPAVESIKYMGVDGSNELNASYQQFTFVQPEFSSTPMITRYVPEQLNITDIRIELVETRL